MHCRNCNQELQVERHGTFCSISCRTTFTNLNRARNPETGSKISEGLLMAKAAKRAMGTVGFPVRLDRIDAPFSRIFINTCAHCEVKSTSRIKRKFCDEHSDRYHRKERDRFAFTFRLEHYPQLFDIKAIREIGLYHPKKNVDGLSRDHRVSVNEALKHDYDPFYIKHPLNCLIMTQRENSAKKAKSSITYDELRRIVDAFEMADLAGNDPATYGLTVRCSTN
jgi:hypothetical protein